MKDKPHMFSECTCMYIRTCTCSTCTCMYVHVMDKGAYSCGDIDTVFNTHQSLVNLVDNCGGGGREGGGGGRGEGGIVWQLISLVCKDNEQTMTHIECMRGSQIVTADRVI